MQIAEWPSPCSHEFCPVREIRFPSDRQTLYYVESCNRCPRITLYDASTKEAVLGTEERKWMPARMTTTPTGHVILSDIGGDRLVGLRWDPNDRSREVSPLRTEPELCPNFCVNLTLRTELSPN